MKECRESRQNQWQAPLHPQSGEIKEHVPSFLMNNTMTRIKKKNVVYGQNFQSLTTNVLFDDALVYSMTIHCGNK